MRANISADDLPKLLAFAQEKKIELTVVGPDNPLALGIVDLFQKRSQIRRCGLRSGDRTKKRRNLNRPKFSRRISWRNTAFRPRAPELFPMRPPRRNLPRELGGKCAVKADGLALGKGVLICANLSEGEQGD